MIWQPQRTHFLNRDSMRIFSFQGYNVYSNLSCNYKSNWKQRKSMSSACCKKKRREKKQKERRTEKMEEENKQPQGKVQTPCLGSPPITTAWLRLLTYPDFMRRSRTRYSHLQELIHLHQGYSLHGHLHARSYVLHPYLILDKQLWILINCTLLLLATLQLPKQILMNSSKNPLQLLTFAS